MKSFLILLCLTTVLFSQNSYFVSKKGKDSNRGTIKRPFKSLKKAISLVEAGDTIYIRSGRYPIYNRVYVKGEQDKPITIQAYKNEKVVFIGSYGKDKIYNLNQNASHDSFIVTGSWLIFRNLEFKNGTTALHIKSNASHNRFENLSIHDNYYSSLVLTDGASDNTIINCDAYHNFDSNSKGQHADGFVIVGHKREKTPHIGKGNMFINCRSWGNSDDGFDCWQSGNPVIFINCLSYENGHDIWKKSKEFKGDGNGFKLGVHNRYGHMQDAHIVINCKAWRNNSRGFDYNDNEVAITMFRNISWKNKNSGYKFRRANHNLIQNINIESGDNYLSKDIYEEGNSWNKRDYNIKEEIISFDDKSIKAKRDKKGQIDPKGFLELKSDSLFFEKETTQKYDRLMHLMFKIY